MTRHLRIGIAACLVASLALVAGCGAIAEKATRGAVEKATGVKVDDKGGSVTVTGKDGEQATFSSDEGKVPENLPADFPVYEGTVDGAGAIETEEASTFSFTIITKDPVKTVHEWYQEQLKAKGWTIEHAATTEMNGVPGGSLSAKKAPASEVVVTTSSDEDKPDQTSAMIILTVKKK